MTEVKFSHVFSLAQPCLLQAFGWIKQKMKLSVSIYPFLSPHPSVGLCAGLLFFQKHKIKQLRNLENEWMFSAVIRYTWDAYIPYCNIQVLAQLQIPASCSLHFLGKSRSCLNSCDSAIHHDAFPTSGCCLVLPWLMSAFGSETLYRRTPPFF